MTFTAASMFSGIGGAELALPEAEWLWCAEIEAFPSDVLAQRFGHANLGDVLAPDFIDRATALGPLNLLCGGPPCQAFSVAGNRLSMADPRGNLSLRFVQVAHAIRPRNLLVENVPGWLNTEDNAFGCFLGAIVGADDPLLPCARPAAGKSNAGWKWRKAGRAWMLREFDEAGLPIWIDDPDEYEPSQIQQVDVDARHIPAWPSAGMAAGPRARIAWRVLDAQYADLAQRRERVFAVVDFGEGADPAAVLFEPKGLLGDTPPRREAGEGVTGTLSARTDGGGGLGTDFECQGGLTPETVAARMVAFGEYDDDGTASTIKARDWKDATDLVAHTLRGEGFDASEDGTGRGTPLVPVQQFAELDVAGTMMAYAKSGGDSNRVDNAAAGYMVPVAFSSKDYGGDASDDLSPTLRSMGHADSHANGGGQIAIAMQAGMVRENPSSGPDGKGWQPDVAYTIEARAEVQAVAFDTTQITSPSNYSSPKPEAPCHPLAAGAHPPAIALQDVSGRDKGQNGKGWSDQDCAYTVDAAATQGVVAFTQNQREELREIEVAGALPAEHGTHQQAYIATEWAVRRLTPAECEKLQGYPLGHTLIETGKRRTVTADEAEYLRMHGAVVTLGNDGELRTNAAADGPRYKALGNAWAVACVRPIAKRIYDLQMGVVDE